MLRLAYNALISTDCLVLRGVSPFTFTFFFESEYCARLLFKSLTQTLVNL
jgi:hypothetical protein